MDSEIVGYVKSLAVTSSHGDGSFSIMFAPVRPYLLEDEDEKYCLFREKSGGADRKAFMRRLVKDGSLEMKADVGVRDVLVAAKVTHCKVRIGLVFPDNGGSESEDKGKDNGGELKISTVELI